MSTTSSNTNSVSGPIVRYDPNQARPLQVENEIGNTTLKLLRKTNALSTDIIVVTVGSSSKTEPESQAGSSEAVLPTPVFVTISTNARLGEGISIVRSLGGGQYEIMNIGQTDHATLTSEETAHMIKADDERMKAMNSAGMQWGKLSYTVNQTIKAAGKSPFRPIFVIRPCHYYHEMRLLSYVIPSFKSIHIPSLCLFVLHSMHLSVTHPHVAP